MRLFSPQNLSRTAALSGGAEERRESALRTLRLRGEKMKGEKIKMILMDRDE
jgi:hypothetical protein